MNGKAAVAVVGVAALAGVTFWAVKDAAARHENAEPTDFTRVVGDSGAVYLIADTFREQDGQTIAIVGVMTEDETPILVYQQFVGDRETRIWDKAAGGLPTTDTRWLAAVQDFGVFTSV